MPIFIRFTSTYSNFFCPLVFAHSHNKWGRTPTKSSTDTSDNEEDNDHDDETVNPEEMVAVKELMEEQKKIHAIEDELYRAKYSSADGGQCNWGSFSVES